MKIKVTLKDPDALYEAINDAMKELKIDGLSDEELEAIKEPRRESIQSLCHQWFEYGEYLTVEIDTEAQTCIVIPISK